MLKIVQTIVVLGGKPQKQPPFIAVLCEDRLFNLLALSQNGMTGKKLANIHEAEIIADVCNLI